MRSDDVGEEIISASHSSIELNVSGAVDSYKLSYIFSDVEVFLEARSARFIARCWSRPPRLPSRRTWSRSGVDRLFNAIAPYSCRSCNGRLVGLWSGHGSGFVRIKTILSVRALRVRFHVGFVKSGVGCSCSCAGRDDRPVAVPSVRGSDDRMWIVDRVRSADVTCVCDHRSEACT
jgi:hypothetical protein